MHPGLLVRGAAHEVGGGHDQLYLPPEGVAGGVRGAVYQRVLNMELQLSTAGEVDGHLVAAPGGDLHHAEQRRDANPRPQEHSRPRPRLQHEVPARHTGLCR